jgi:hypothetical protein
MVAFFTNRRLISFLVCLVTVLSMGISSQFIKPVNAAAFDDDCTEEQLRDLGVSFVNCDGEPFIGECSVTGTVINGGGSSSISQLLSLTFPTFSDEAAIISGIRSEITRRYSESNWIGLEQFIFDRSREQNVNPLFIVATGGLESSFGDSDAGRNNNNYFGNKETDRSYKYFSSPEEGIGWYIDRIPRYLSGELSNGRYKDVKNIYEYSSIHQTGSIVYPGEPFDPEDQDDKPGNTADLWDPAMGVYISWDENANNRPDVNPKYKGNTYNPLNYYRGVISIINGITGENFPDTPGGVGECDTKTAGANGWDLPGEGPNPMFYYSQRSDGTDSAVQGYFGSLNYGPGPIAHCGCGPVSWAMIVGTLKGDDSITPDIVANWASDNGFQIPNSSPCGGSLWWWENMGGLSETRWGVKAKSITIDQAANELRSGNLIMASAGPGPFTSGGHLLVMRAVTDDGKFLFADPNDYNDPRQEASVFGGNSKSRTPLSKEQLSSIKGLWSVSKL